MHSCSTNTYAEQLRRGRRIPNWEHGRTRAISRVDQRSCFGFRAASFAGLLLLRIAAGVIRSRFASAKRPPRTATAEASLLPKNKRGQGLAGLRYFFFFLAGFFAAFLVAIESSSLWTFSLGRCL